MLVFFTNQGFIKLQIRYLVLFCLFSVIHNFGWFWIGTLHKNIQLILKFLKAPFLVLHFFYYTLMTLLMMLSVILLSRLMILLSNLCHQASDLWQQVVLASGLESDLQDTVEWGREKTCWFQCLSYLTGLITLVLLMWKWMGLFLRKNNLL